MPKGGHKWYKVRRRLMRGRESEREDCDEFVAPLSLFRIVAASDLMSPWYNAEYGWPGPHDGDGRRRGQLERVLRGRMALADVQC